MAVKTFEEIISGLSAQEKTLLDNLFAKEPELKKGWLRQDDYSRQQNELKTKQAEYEDAVAYKAKMEPWAADAYDRIHNLEEAGVIDKEGKVLWTDQKAELEKKLQEAEALGGDMKPEELDKLVTDKVTAIAKAAGGLTKEEIQALYRSEMASAVEEGFKTREKDFNEKTIPMVGGFSASVAMVAAHYEQESGKKWKKEDSARLYKVMGEEQKFDALDVEDKFLEPVRAEAAAKKELEKAIADAVEKDRKERGYGTPGSGGERYIPQPPGQDVRGTLQKALEESEKAGETDVRDAVRAAVVEGAQELTTAGKF